MHLPLLSLALPLLLALASCTSPPKPPKVDESEKRPANSAMAVELQVCRSELHNTRIVATETARAAEAAAQRHAQRVAAEREARPVERRNLLHTVLFAFNSSRIELTEPQAMRLLADAQAAPLIVLRGRTDGTIETPAEARIARERARTVEAFLLHGGIEPARIRSTWQAVGDHAASNDTAGGRALNRRVEIEIYPVAPKSMMGDGPAGS